MFQHPLDSGLIVALSNAGRAEMGIRKIHAARLPHLENLQATLSNL